MQRKDNFYLCKLFFFTQSTKVLLIKIIVSTRNTLHYGGDIWRPMNKTDFMHALLVTVGVTEKLIHLVNILHRFSSILFFNGYLSRLWINFVWDDPLSVLTFVLSLAYLPVHVMLPPKRMEILLEQAVSHQVQQCKYHNRSITSTSENTSLLADHSCSR